MASSQRPPDGGPAFPARGIEIDKNGLDWSVESKGMTLRDYFAAHALTGVIANDSCGEGITKHGISGLCTASYAIADAMLKAREEAK